MFNIILKELREEKGISQNELANILGVSRPTVTKYETGEREPSFQILNKISDYFGVSTDYLLGKTEIKHFEDLVLIESIKTKFKNYPSSVISIVDTVCSIIINKDTVENIDAMDTILKELYKVMKK